MHSHGFSVKSSLHRSAKHSVTASQMVRNYYPPPRKFPGFWGGVYEDLYWAYRTVLFYLHYEWEDTELEEFDTHVIRHKPESLDSLLRQTKFTRKELQLMYRGFKQGCPTGLVTLEQFKHIYTQFFPHGASDAGKYAQFVFNTFDKDGNGQITFEELAIGLSVLSRGTIQDKLDWIFQLYDINRRGQIAKEDLFVVLSSIYDLLGKYADPPFDTRTVQKHVTDIFSKIDKNDDGVITREEFIDACGDDPAICESLALFHTVI